jgi:hypothetical protein
MTPWCHAPRTPHARQCCYQFCAWGQFSEAAALAPQSRTFAQLASYASAVPVPKAGVTFVGEDQSVEDGPGFTSAKYNVVTRQYSSSLSCQALERSWADVLTRAHREFRIYHYPHKFGAIGSLEIDITDTPDNLVIFIGFDSGECNKPLLSASDSPH